VFLALGSLSIMLASKYKLKRSKVFDEAKSRGKLHQQKLFGISVLERKDDQPSKFGFVISKKVSKQAVQRNRINRAVQETIRFEMTHIKEGFDVIFLLKQEAARSTTDEIMRAVRVAIKEVGLIKLSETPGKLQR
jgi:ribonuclease P protein component